MRKFVIGLFVFGVFVVYTIGMRHEQPLIARPRSLLNHKSTTTTTSHSTTTSNQPKSVASSQSSSQYQDGTYTGSIVNAYYGNVEVSATISGGKITDVKFLQYPNSHSTSVYINQQVIPYLRQEAIQAQSSHVQLITGATFTSEAFIQSLAAALAKA